MKVIAEIDVYKINGIETPPIDRPIVKLLSCGLYSPRIAVVVHGTRVEVNADELLEAVKRVQGV